MKKKIFLIILILLFFLTAGTVKALIDSTPLVTELKDLKWQLGSHTFANVNKITQSLTTLIIGTGDPEVDQILRGTAVGGITNLIAAMYANPPASSAEYFADLGRNLGIVKPAYAQSGVGFGGLLPILPLWKAFRNVAYLFFIIIFVVMGFVIMFRMKLNPQTVISIQNAIPRIVVALILVTFSYAIAGLMIDLLYIFILLFIAISGSFGLIPAAQIDSFKNRLVSGGFFDLMVVFFGSTQTTMWVALSGIGAIVGAVVGLIFEPTKIIGAVVGAGVGLVLFDLIIAVILLYILFKLLIELIKVYINIIMAVIFGPLQIMVGILPGVEMGFGSWLKNLFANIAVFPAVAIFIIIARRLIDIGGSLWYPPMVGLTGAVTSGLIGFGMLLLISKVPQMVKNALQIKPFLYGTAIGEAFGPVKAGGKMVFYTAAGEIVGPEGFLEKAGKKKLAMVGRKILGMK